MKEKSRSKNNGKTSVVRRVKKKNDLFYKNLDPSKSDLNRGLERGEKILSSLLSKSNGNKFTNFILKEFEESIGLIEIKYGPDVASQFFPIVEYTRSVLENGGNGNIKILKNFVRAIEKEDNA